jgi:prepilin-type N-terminal cleavage/methylation domain-containing protein
MSVHRRTLRGDEGISLIEMLVTLVLFGILAAVAVGPYRTYHQVQQQKGSTRDLVEGLRGLQVRAVAEETTYRAVFATDGKSVAMARLNPSTGTYVSVGSLSPSTASISYGSPTFYQSDGSTSSTVYFYARGAATKGTVLVSRSGTSKVYTVSVEGLTARVSYN